MSVGSEQHPSWSCLSGKHFPASKVLSAARCPLQAAAISAVRPDSAAGMSLSIDQSSHPQCQQSNPQVSVQRCSLPAYRGSGHSTYQCDADTGTQGVQNGRLCQHEWQRSSCTECVEASICQHGLAARVLTGCSSRVTVTVTAFDVEALGVVFFQHFEVTSKCLGQGGAPFRILAHARGLTGGAQGRCQGTWTGRQGTVWQVIGLGEHVYRIYERWNTRFELQIFISAL